MSVQKQLLSNKRLWVRLLSLAVIVGIALLKPMFDEWTGAGDAADTRVTQADTGPEQSGNRSGTAAAGQISDPSLEDLLASVRDDAETEGDDHSNDFQATKAAAATQAEKSSTRQQTQDKSSASSQTNSGKSTDGSTSKNDRSSRTTGTNRSGSDSSRDTAASKNGTTEVRLGKLTLIKGTRDEFRSTAGLMYLPGSADRHRLKHVLKHAKDDPSKPIHGVFEGDRDQILEWIDRAYLMGKKGDTQVRKEQQRDRIVYTANLNERVGYVGGQKGKRDGRKECRYLRLVLQNGTEVVTAYPSDRM